MEATLQMHTMKTVYLLVRSYNDWHVQSLESVQCKLDGAKSPLAAPVYDLPLDYRNLDTLNDILHSSQLSDIAIQLHNDEVDFSNNTRGISGALQGIDCKDYEWFVQENPDVNCRTNKDHTSCIKPRYTNKNVVEFRNMFLKDGHHYFICVHASNGSCSSLPMKMCSNGFIVDTLPPIPGNVYVGHDIVSKGHPDNTSMLIRWDGFKDTVDEVAPYSSGIKEYFFAIGKIYSLYFMFATFCVSYIVRW